ncbi:unnamed protein product, partial [Mesorhabditis spiculigera]
MEIIFCVLVILGLAYSAPATANDVVMHVKMDVNEVFPEELFKILTPELQDFFKSLEVQDIMSFTVLGKEKASLKTPNQALEALKRTNEETYKKVNKLVEAYKKRFADLTPGARKLLEDSIVTGDLGTMEVSKLAGGDPGQKAKNFREALLKASDADKQSMQKQLPLLYKLITDPEILDRLRPEMERNVKKYLTKFGAGGLQDDQL